MPNPVKLLALDGTKAHFSKNADYAQRISFTRVGQNEPEHRVQLPADPLHLETGEWMVLHEASSNNGASWYKGRGRSPNDQRAEFDDNPTGGDNDFNDAIVQLRHDN